MSVYRHTNTARARPRPRPPTCRHHPRHGSHQRATEEHRHPTTPPRPTIQQGVNATPSTAEPDHLKPTSRKVYFRDLVRLFRDLVPLLFFIFCCLSMNYKIFAFFLIHRFREKVLFLYCLYYFRVGVVHQDRTDRGQPVKKLKNFCRIFFCRHTQHRKGAGGNIGGGGTKAGIRGKGKNNVK